MDIRSSMRDVSQGIHGPALLPPVGLRHLAVAAATEQKKTGKKHPGKAILAGQYQILSVWMANTPLALTKHLGIHNAAVTL